MVEALNLSEPLSDIRVGSLEARLARTPEEIDAAQALRYRVFYEEMTAVPTPEMRARKRDFDAFDAICRVRHREDRRSPR
jgi:putative hemolysin